LTHETSLINREYIGTVLSAKDSSHRGKYKVNVPELQPHMKENTGIWCKNHVHNYRVTPTENGVCGSYFPLHPGMSVIVKFFANHIESAYIDRIISDAYVESLPYEIIERDDYYQILRTPKHNNLIAIYEGSENSKNVPKNSIHIYFNDLRTTIVIDESGINIKTADNINTTIAGNCRLTVTGTTDIKSTGKINIQSTDNIEINSAATIDIEGKSLINVKAGGNINIDGANVNINCGLAASAGVATPATAPTLITNSDYEYFKRKSGK